MDTLEALKAEADSIRAQLRSIGRRMDAADIANDEHLYDTLKAERDRVGQTLDSILARTDAMIYESLADRVNAGAFGGRFQAIADQCIVWVVDTQNRRPIRSFGTMDDARTFARECALYTRSRAQAESSDPLRSAANREYARQRSNNNR